MKEKILASWPYLNLLVSCISLLSVFLSVLAKEPHAAQRPSISRACGWGAQPSGARKCRHFVHTRFLPTTPRREHSAFGLPRLPEPPTGPSSCGLHLFAAFPFSLSLVPVPMEWPSVEVYGPLTHGELLRPEGSCLRFWASSWL